MKNLFNLLAIIFYEAIDAISQSKCDVTVKITDLDFLKKGTKFRKHTANHYSCRKLRF
jgi:hypothetical protein